MATAENKMMPAVLEGAKLLDCLILPIWTSMSQELINQVAHWIWQFPVWGWKIISAPKLTDWEAFYSARSKRQLRYQRTCDFSIRLMQSRRICLCPVPQRALCTRGQGSPTLPHLTTGFRADFFPRVPQDTLITSYRQRFSTETKWKQRRKTEIRRQKCTLKTPR